MRTCVGRLLATRCRFAQLIMDVNKEAQTTLAFVVAVYLRTQICEAPYPIVNVIAEPPAMQPRSLSPRLRGVVAPGGSSDKELYNELADTARLTDSWRKSQ